MSASLGARLGRRLLAKRVVRQLERLSRPEAAFVRWAACAVLTWRPSPGPRRVPVYHIHGSDDRVLPAGLGRPDMVVPGGGHALSLFSPAAVNGIIADVVRTVRQTNLCARK